MFKKPGILWAVNACHTADVTTGQLKGLLPCIWSEPSWCISLPHSLTDLQLPYGEVYHTWSSACLFLPDYINISTVDKSLWSGIGNCCHVTVSVVLVESPTMMAEVIAAPEPHMHWLWSLFHTHWSHWIPFQQQWVVVQWRSFAWMHLCQLSQTETWWCLTPRIQFFLWIHTPSFRTQGTSS